MKIPVVLGVDYGQKRVGVAQLIGVLAQPHSIISHDEEVFAKLLNIAQQLQVAQIVFGISEGVSAQRTQEFVSEFEQYALAQAQQFEVIFFDETLSSQQAYATALGKRRVRSHEPIDDIAAALILEEWEAAGRPSLSNQGGL